MAGRSSGGPAQPITSIGFATPSLSGVALVTGGGRSVGAHIAGGLARAGMRVAIGARSAEEVERTATEIGALGLELDVVDAGSIAAAVERTERQLGPIDLLVANAGIDAGHEPFWESPAEDWWRVFEVNARGVYLSCRAVAPGMIARRGGRIVVVASNGAFLPEVADGVTTAYGASKAAAQRFGELAAQQLTPHGVKVFTISPGFVKSSITARLDVPDDAPWVSPDAAPELVVGLASGEFDALSGRYLEAVPDAPEVLRERMAAILADDLNVVRLRR